MGLSNVLNELKRTDLSFKDELYSENFYETLHSLKDLTSYFKNCSSLDNLPFSTNIKKICATVLKYIETLHKEIYDPDNPYDVCLLLNYWVYSRLFNILRFKGSRYVEDAYRELQDIWIRFLEDKLKKPENQTCKPISELFLYDDWRERKELYEYYVDYYPVSETVKSYPVRCNEFYHYVERKKPLYKHFKELCTGDHTNRCPQFYAQCEQYDPDQVLSHLSCHNEIMKERSSAATSVVERRNTHSDSETQSIETSVVMVPVYSPNLNEKSHTVTKVGNILLGVVATSITSGALYRFTPLGSMLRNVLGWNTNNMSNMNRGDIRLYDYASESFNPYSGGEEEHYIGYHHA